MQLLSRADLLKLLAEHPEPEHQLVAQAMGFSYRIYTQLNQPEIEPTSFTNQVEPKANDAVMYTARIQYQFWAVTKCQAVNDEEPVVEYEPWQQGEIVPDLPYRGVAEQAVLNPGQWQNLWDDALRTQRKSNQIHLKLSVLHLSRSRPIRQLPKRPRKTFTRSVTLLLERSQELRPAWDVILQTRQTLVALLGKEAVQSFYLSEGPQGDWSRLGASGLGGVTEIADDSLVILVGSFGSLKSEKISPDWQRLLSSLRQRGLHLLLLSIRPLHQSGSIIWPVQMLDPRANVGKDSQNISVQTLLDVLSQVWLSNEKQLRNLRLAVPQASLMTELQVYNHSALDRDSIYMRLREEKLKERLRAYEKIDQKIKDRVQQVVSNWQNSLGATARDAENLQRQLLNNPDPKQFVQLNRQARLIRQQFDQGQKPGMAYGLIRSMLPVLRLLQNEPHSSGWLYLMETAQKIALQTGAELPLAHKGLQSTGPLRQLHQRHHHLQLNETPNGMLAIGDQAYCQQTEKIIRDRLSGNFAQLDIIDLGIHWQLKKLTKPRWAQRFWRNTEGLFAAHEDNVIFQYLEASPENPQASWQLAHNLWSWATDSGIDDYGLWVELQIKQVSFRLRWIAAGEFLMGSAEDEPERENAEIQHKVTLTQGYWLADTTCTQALWQEVMGDNPSHFKNQPQNPVEQVSWDDCQDFIKQLNQQLGGDIFLRLPTEAEWEYACRAGTRTTFSWGNTMTTEQANYDGSSPYNKGEKGEDRNRTVAVSEFEPNPWGLIQMHGNVWEWCLNWLSDYSQEPVVDPKGSEGGHDRVLRGGSWIQPRAPPALGLPLCVLA